MTPRVASDNAGAHRSLSPLSVVLNAGAHRGAVSDAFQRGPLAATPALLCENWRENAPGYPEATAAAGGFSGSGEMTGPPPQARLGGSMVRASPALANKNRSPLMATKALESMAVAWGRDVEWTVAPVEDESLLHPKRLAPVEDGSLLHPKRLAPVQDESLLPPKPFAATTMTTAEEAIASPATTVISQPSAGSENRQQTVRKSPFRQPTFLDAEAQLRKCDSPSERATWLPFAGSLQATRDLDLTARSAPFVCGTCHVPHLSPAASSPDDFAKRPGYHMGLRTCGGNMLHEGSVTAKQQFRESLRQQHRESPRAPFSNVAARQNFENGSWLLDSGMGMQLPASGRRNLFGQLGATVSKSLGVSSGCDAIGGCGPESDCTGGDYPRKRAFTRPISTVDPCVGVDAEAGGSAWERTFKRARTVPNAHPVMVSDADVANIATAAAKNADLARQLQLYQQEQVLAGVTATTAATTPATAGDDDVALQLQLYLLRRRQRQKLRLLMEQRQAEQRQAEQWLHQQQSEQWQGEQWQQQHQQQQQQWPAEQWRGKQQQLALTEHQTPATQAVQQITQLQQQQADARQEELALQQHVMLQQLLRGVQQEQEQGQQQRQLQNEQQQQKQQQKRQGLEEELERMMQPQVPVEQQRQQQQQQQPEVQQAQQQPTQKQKGAAAAAGSRNPSAMLEALFEKSFREREERTEACKSRDTGKSSRGSEGNNTSKSGSGRCTSGRSSFPAAAFESTQKQSSGRCTSGQSSRLQTSLPAAVDDTTSSGAPMAAADDSAQLETFRLLSAALSACGPLDPAMYTCQHLGDSCLEVPAGDLEALESLLAAPHSKSAAAANSAAAAGAVAALAAGIPGAAAAAGPPVCISVSAVPALGSAGEYGGSDPRTASLAACSSRGNEAAAFASPVAAASAVSSSSASARSIATPAVSASPTRPASVFPSKPTQLCFPVPSRFCEL